MRLWHQDLLEHLPKQILLGQHRECCALRGKGWDKKHSTVQYALDDKIEKLIAYHREVMSILIDKFEVEVDSNWFMSVYRGKKLGCDFTINIDLVYTYNLKTHVYDYHNEQYRIECLDNLWGKMTTDIKKWTGDNYGLKYRSEVCAMFKKHYKDYINDKIEEFYHYEEV